MASPNESTTPNTRGRRRASRKFRSDVIPEPTEYEHLPFGHLNQKGYGYHTLLVEPPIFLKKLRTELTGTVQLTQRTFASAADVVRLPEPIVVNCTGMGSGTSSATPNSLRSRASSVLVKAQPALQYLYSSDETYVFPREDHVVVGGSYEFHVWDPLDPYKAMAILQDGQGCLRRHFLPSRCRGRTGCCPIPVTHAYLIADYLIDRLTEHGVERLFGVPAGVLRGGLRRGRPQRRLPHRGDQQRPGSRVCGRRLRPRQTGCRRWPFPTAREISALSTQSPVRISNAARW